MFGKNIFEYVSVQNQFSQSSMCYKFIQKTVDWIVCSEHHMISFRMKNANFVVAQIAIKVNERLSSANRNRGGNVTASNKENNDTIEPVEDEDLRNHDTNQPRQGILRTNTTNTRPAGGRYR